MIDTLVIMFIGAVGLQIFAEPLIGIFSMAEETNILCIRAIRIITAGYLFVGANIAYQGIFQALGYGVHSLIVSAIRLLIGALPIAWILVQVSQYWIWAAFPIAEAIAFVVAVFMMRSVNKKTVNQISGNQPSVE